MAGRISKTTMVILLTICIVSFVLLVTLGPIIGQSIPGFPEVVLGSNIYWVFGIIVFIPIIAFFIIIGLYFEK